MEEEGMKDQSHTHNTPLVWYIRRVRCALGEWQERRSRTLGETTAGLVLGLGRKARWGRCARGGGEHEEGGGNALSVCAKRNVRADEEGPARGGGIDARGGSNDVCEGRRRKSRERERPILLLILLHMNTRSSTCASPSFVESPPLTRPSHTRNRRRHLPPPWRSRRGGLYEAESGRASHEWCTMRTAPFADGSGSEPAPSYENGASAVTGALLGGEGGACDESDTDADVQGDSEAGRDGGEDEERGDAQAKE
ncbi:hypothetical protein B0H14DRAFT_3163386 [Mycena olivaceomarginata]|nr:hypothetical protein B0H14DRAFT_3163386 [Mycena olivaceomarginata]